MNWIVENFEKDNFSKDFYEAIKRNGHHLEVVNPEYFNGPVDYSVKNDVIFHGSILLSRIGKEKRPNWTPFSWLTQENYLCSKYYPYFSDILFNNKHCFIHLKQLKEDKFFYYGVFGKQAFIFMRPNDGEKSFQSQLIDLQDFDRYYESEKFGNPNNLVVISTPKNIRGEYRFIVSKDGIISHSTYMYQGQLTKIPSVPSRAKNLCLEVLKRGYFPDKVFCVDVVEDNDGVFWLMELNSFSSCGLYACDKDKIVKKISEIAVS
jgi:hypothetical protein